MLDENHSAGTKSMPQPCHNWISTHYHSLVYSNRTVRSICMCFGLILPNFKVLPEFKSLLLRQRKSRLSGFFFFVLFLLFSSFFSLHFRFLYSCFIFRRDFQTAGSSMMILLQQTFRKKEPGNDIFCLTKPLFCDRITHVDEHEACRNGEVA